MLASESTQNALARIMNERMLGKKGGANQRLAIMLGWLTMDREHPIRVNIPDADRSKYAQTKWKFLLSAPFEISNVCCRVMKKEPSHRYQKQTGKKAMTAQMTEESRLRQQKWLQNGCNFFDARYPISNPMAFWTENDVLEYIFKHHLRICPVYGEVVPSDGGFEGQLSFDDYGLKLDGTKFTTTGCKRTGCMLCGFGCHLEKSPNRFEQLRETHPKMYALLDKVKNSGVTMREAIEWMNAHGDVNIKL